MISHPTARTLRHWFQLFITCTILSLALTLNAARQLVTPSAITSSTAADDFFPVFNLIDDSGLSASPNITNYTSITHAAANASTAWVTKVGGADWYAGGNPNPILTCTLNETYELTDLVVWGYHFGSPNNNEAKDFTVEFSTDQGATWQNPIHLSHSRTAQSQDTLPFGEIISANAVRVTITDNHFGTAGAGGGDRVGLGELKLIGEAPPNPNPIIQVTNAIAFGNFPAPPEEQTLSLTVRNAGTEQPLEIASVDLIGPNTTHFSVTGAPLTINAAERATLIITFNALGLEGCFAAALRIQSNDPESPLRTLLLTASVNCAPQALAPPTFSVPEGTFSEPFTLELTNSANSAVMVFTTDGTLPSEANGMLYIDPIDIVSTVQIRAATLLPSQEPVIATRSYVRLAPDLRQYSSGLPILIVENFGRGIIPDKGWTTATQTGAGLRQPARQPAFLQLIDQEDATGMASMTGTPHLTTRMGIRVRGAFSSTWDPKPYSVETWDEGNESKSIEPLGLPRESDWILYFPHPSYDLSMLYNTFIWELSSQTGRYGTRFRFVDVFINENGGDLSLADRRGVYAFTEKVKRDDNRIDFEPLSEDGATGGWLLAINRMDPIPVNGFPTENGATSPQFFHTPGPNRVAQTPPNTSGQGDDIPRQYNAFINFENPNGYRINAAQRAAIENWFVEFENIFYDNAVWRDPTNGYRRYVDTRDVIDYFLLLNLGRQGDGLLLSVFPWVSSGDRRLHMGPMWDFNNGAYGGNAEATLYFRQDRLWYPRFFQDPDFLREYIDRWFQLRRGPLANANMAALIDRQAAQIPAALVPAQGLSVATWNNRLNSMKSWLGRRADWIDQQYIAPPEFNTSGGVVETGFVLVLVNPTSIPGTIYFTTDGTDPISSETALTNSMALTQSVEVRARMLSDSGEWSALNEATFIIGIPATSSNLVVSEIMYHPSPAHPDAEFVELLNISLADSIDLTSVRFTNGFRFTFAPGTTLAPGESLLVVYNEAAFATAYGTSHRVAGAFASGRLDNGGETIRLEGATGSVIQEFQYDDLLPWPEAPDGLGYSLVLIAPFSNPDPNVPEHWRSSVNLNGTPGGADATHFEGDPGADLDANDVPDFLDYAFGIGTTGNTPLPRAGIAADGTLLFRLQRSLAADDAVFDIEVSDNLDIWFHDSSAATLVSRTHAGDGIAVETWRVETARPGQKFIRLRVRRRD